MTYEIYIETVASIVQHFYILTALKLDIAQLSALFNKND
jgi:hypothetical protein